MPSLTRRRTERLLGALIALQLAVAVPAAVLTDPQAVTAQRRAAVTRAEALRAASTARASAVTALLARRSQAVLQRDRDAFLADIDPTQPRFRAQQSKVFDNLAQVPLASWRYVLDATRERAHTPALDRVRGDWWAPTVTLRYALLGFDRVPTEQSQGLTFTRQLGRWFLTSDTDFARSGHPTQRDLWDGGPVRVVRGRACLVLAHHGGALVKRVLDECDAAVPRVTAVWGTAWLQRVVLLVPDTTRELKALIPDVGDVSNIAALATAELVDPSTGYHPVGDRVVVNPDTFTQLGRLGRQVVLTHEVTHVASRASTGPQVPTWFVEGLADYVGFLHSGLPLAVTASELRTALSKGQVPTALPSDDDFAGGRSDLAATYEQSWLAVTLLARIYGQDRMLRLYRGIGASRSGGAVAQAFATDLGTSVSAFTRLWRDDLIAQLR